MLTLAEACVPRSSVFDATLRDTVHDLAELLDDRIDATSFFEESYPTGGMQQLLTQAFRRFAGRDDAPAVYLLSQSMGGGKTHNMIALGLLAKRPEARRLVPGGTWADATVDRVRVIGFSGRDTDAPYGIWGALAKQLGREELFRDHYSPLSPPAPSAWINLLRGDPVLLLLDELPPYFEAARGRAVGDSNLAKLTTTALSNLLVAVHKRELPNVVVVLSDLGGRNYGEGQADIDRALHDMRDETTRYAQPIEPVRANNDELYHILRRRLFARLPKEEDVAAVAGAYAAALGDARKMNLVQASPEKLADEIRESYPFHPSLRDLYARFKENPGFQQTRGILRFLRAVVARAFDAQRGFAKERYLLAPYDLDLNDTDTLAQIHLINDALKNAIAHDVASAGNAVAEQIDARRGGRDAADAARHLLVASLANVPNATLGLSQNELLRDLAGPDRDLRSVPQDVVAPLTGEAWYLHTSREGRVFFKNVENVVAKLRTYAQGYTPDQVLRELRTRLEELFRPASSGPRDCYQRVVVLPAPNEIQMNNTEVLLVLHRPGSSGTAPPPDVQQFWEEIDDKNRVAFLTGERDVLQRLQVAAANAKAIDAILGEMQQAVPESDPQRQEALKLKENLQHALLSHTREAFTVLWYPYADGPDRKLRRAELIFEFQSNEWSGESLIRRTLAEKQKFTKDVDGESFRKKIEMRLFTQKQMQWSEVRRRAGTNAGWPWHAPNALDLAKTRALDRGEWREAGGGWVEKGPFPPPRTDVRVREVARDDDTGEVMLTIEPVHGDVVHYEMGAPATTASQRITDLRGFRTKELELSFLCVDSTGRHDRGEPVTWRNRVTLKFAKTRIAKDVMHVEFRAAPAEATIRYTTDGSDPRHGGGVYDGPFDVRAPAPMVLAVAEKRGIRSEPLQIQLDWNQAGPEVIPDKPALLKRSHRTTGNEDSFALLGRCRRLSATLMGMGATVSSGAGALQRWVEVNLAAAVAIGPERAEELIVSVRPLLEAEATEVDLRAEAVRFKTGRDLLEWVTELRSEIKEGEVEQ